jgi:hypothetical protein
MNRFVAGRRLDRVSKISPDGTQAVHDVDLDVGDGEFAIPSGTAQQLEAAAKQAYGS